MNRTHNHRLILALSLFAIASAIAYYFQFFTPEERLRRELIAYIKSVATDDPRPELVRHLTPDSVTILLKWMQQIEAQPTIRDRFAGLLRRVTSGKVDFFSSMPYVDDPPTLASFGFDFLGTNAAAAIPELSELARRPSGGDALNALISIGAPSLDAAQKFSSDPDPNIRKLSAFLVGTIGADHARSVAILIPLLDDADADVRAEAYAAIAEFPGSETEQILIPRLAHLSRDLSDDPMHAPTAAYALHTGSTNALLHLIDACIRSTNENVQAYLLASLAMRDDAQNPKNENVRSYGARRGNYFRNLQKRITQPPNRAFDNRLYFIRSNIIETGLPHVEKVLGPDNSSTGRIPQNPLQSRP